MKNKYYQEKGIQAEELIAKLCSNAFQADFCFKNPHVDGKELCDVLIVLQNKAIIWQIKSIKEKNGKINDSDISKAIRQCLGAKRKMERKERIILKNVALIDKNIDCKKINEYYLVVAIEDGVPNFSEFFKEKDDQIINIFFPSFTRFALKYLNTVPDLTDYLSKKEAYFKNKNAFINGGEENVLAYFLTNNREFDKFGNQDFICFDDDKLAQKFQENKEIQIRLKEEEKYCTITDFLIEEKRKAVSVYSDVANLSEKKDLVISLFLNMRSHEKQFFGKTFHEAATKANQVNSAKSDPRDIISIEYLTIRSVLFIFVFFGFDDNKYKEKRRELLTISSLGAIKRLDACFEYIIGVATAINFLSGTLSGFEWSFIECVDKKSFNEEIDQKFPNLSDLLDSLGILKNS